MRNRCVRVDERKAVEGPTNYTCRRPYTKKVHLRNTRNCNVTYATYALPRDVRCLIAEEWTIVRGKYGVGNPMLL